MHTMTRTCSSDNLHFLTVYCFQFALYHLAQMCIVRIKLQHPFSNRITTLVECVDPVVFVFLLGLCFYSHFLHHIGVFSVDILFSHFIFRKIFQYSPGYKRTAATLACVASPQWGGGLKLIAVHGRFWCLGVYSKRL